MRRVFYIIFLILIIPGPFSSAQPTMFYFEKGDVRPGFIAATKEYADSSLWGYMNGGADLYLEYGFKHLVHHEIAFRGLLYKADIFEMKDSAAAYGIFSISSFRCQKGEELNVPNCITPHQVQFVAGHFYVSITNVRGDTSALWGGIELAKRLLKKNFFPPYTPPSLFRSGMFSDYQSDIKVIAGPLGLQNGFPDWSEWFESSGKFYITMLVNSDDKGKILFSRIFFDKKEDLERFMKAAELKEKVNNFYWKQVEGDTVRLFIKLDDVSCLYLETLKRHKICDALIAGFDKVGLKAGENNK